MTSENTGVIQNKLDMCIRNQEKERERKERSITQAFSNLEAIFRLFTNSKRVCTLICISNKITYSLIHEMHMRSLHISYESAL